MINQQKVAQKIESQGYIVIKHDMENESPEEWFVFGIWFYLKRDFHIELDWRIGKYYIYLDSAKEIIREKQPRNKSFDYYSAEEFLKGNLLKHYDLFCDISEQIRTNGFSAIEDKKIIDIVKRGDNKYVLGWIVEEWANASVYCIINKQQPLMMLSVYGELDKLFEEATRRGFELVQEKVSWADDDDDECFETKVVGFKEIDFSF
ncbi:MAG: hypothetical protein IJX68_00675 [Rikenellaceae bacterium]|nr:hypothetical protein [Rikenellaceae bacterium]